MLSQAEGAGYRQPMRLFTLLFIGLALHSIEAKEPDGFRGIRWGAAPNGLAEAAPADENGLAFYTRPGEKMNIGPAKLEKILYQFYKGEFSAVFVMFKGASNRDHLRTTMITEFGDPTKDDDDRLLESYAIWAREGVNIGLRFNYIRDEGTLLYLYKPSQERQAKEKQDAAKNASGDL